MTGRRVKFRRGFPGRRARPGDYCRVPRGSDPREDGSWYVVAPDGGAGALLPSKHAIVEHEDRTITVSPSIVMPNGWHGFLERGEWRSV